MFCSLCGLEIKETDKVCPACGQPNENYVAPEGAEEAAAEAVVEEAVTEAAVAVEEAVEVAEEAVEVAEEVAEAVEEAPAKKKSLAKPIVALALSGFALLSFASGLIPLIMAIVSRVLIKPYKNVTEKPVSLFAKLTNIFSIVAIILSAIATVVGAISFAVSFITSLLSGAAVVGGIGLGGLYFGNMFDFSELFELLFDIFLEILEAIGLY